MSSKFFDLDKHSSLGYLETMLIDFSKNNIAIDDLLLRFKKKLDVMYGDHRYELIEPEIIGNKCIVGAYRQEIERQKAQLENLKMILEHVEKI